MDARFAHGCYGYTCHADSAGLRRNIPAHPRDWLWKCLTCVQRIRLSVILQSATIHAKERYDVSNAGQSNTNASLHNVHCCIRNVRRSVAHDCRCNNFGVILGCFGTWKHLLRSHGEKIKRISMKHTYIISFIAALLGFFCGIPAAASDAENEEIDVKEVVLGHMSDAHEWHITTWNDVHVTIPLPVIVRSETSGWHVFSSARFHDNADGIYEGFYENSEDGKVYEKTPAGDVRPLDISITKNVLQLWIVAALMLSIFLGCSRWYKKKKPSDNAPKGFVGMMEMFVMSIHDDVIKANIGEKHYRFYAPYLLTAFFFIFFSNLLGLVPIFPGGANLTGNIAITLFLALCTFLAVNLFGNRHYWKEIFWPEVPLMLKCPIPLMPVIEFFGILTKPLALMVRLFANVMAGHSIILSLTCIIFVTCQIGIGIGATLSTVSVVILIFMNTLELLIAFIQAYVFTMLSAVFIGQAHQEAHS